MGQTGPRVASSWDDGIAEPSVGRQWHGRGEPEYPDVDDQANETGEDQLPDREHLRRFAVDGPAGWAPNTERSCQALAP